MWVVYKTGIYANSPSQFENFCFNRKEKYNRMYAYLGIIHTLHITGTLILFRLDLVFLPLMEKEKFKLLMYKCLIDIM